nr:zinc finger protein 624-like [Lytechinus pictus]
MEGNYPPGFYLPDRDQQENRHHASQQQQPPPPPQQQHVAHFPMDIPIPYHTSSQHQPEFVDHQPLRAFTIPHPAAPMLSSIYHDPAPGVSNAGIIHQARQQLPVHLRGHGIKSTLAANYAPPGPPITTHDIVRERNNLPITTHESVERNIQNLTTPDQSAKNNPSHPQGQPSTITTSAKQIQSIHQATCTPSSSHQTTPTPSSAGTTNPTPNASRVGSQLFAALNLKKTKPVLELPQNLAFKTSAECKVEGVLAKEVIMKGVEFGPYAGTLLNEEEGWSWDTTWEVCLSDFNSFLYIDGQKTWMPKVKCARNEEEQNMEAFQCYGKIYFRSTKVIEPGCELRVFYSEEYAKHVGIETRLKDLKFNKDAQKFQCSHCEGMFTSPKLILRHIRCEHNNSEPCEMIPVLSWKRKGKKKGKEKIPMAVKANVAVKTNMAAKMNFNHKVPKKREVNEEEEESKFKCDTCGKAFPSLGRLKEHELFHEMMNGDKPYECSECSQRYTAQSSLNRHEREAHGFLNDYKPRNRQKKSKPKKGPKKPLHCQYCGQGYKSRGALANHERKIHGSRQQFREPEPPTDEPQDMLGRPSDYYQRPYKCRFCPKRYTSWTTVEQHEKEVHTGEGTFKCSHCPKICASESRLKEHLVVHNYMHMHRCTLCPRSFASESALKNHQGEHTGLKPFKCEICGRGFRTRKLTLKHKQRMHQERPKRFMCSICNKGFAEKCNLKVHERRHKGIRQFVCLECGKGFTARFSLTAHMQAMHIKERPFTCEVCGKSFALNHHYNHHMAKHRLQGDDSIPEEIQT